MTFALTRKIPGISGIFGRLFARGTTDRPWRLLFLAGLILGAGITFALSPHAAEFQTEGRSLLFFAIGGLLVGLGTRVGGGCTSGHGVCGVGRGSRRAIVATLVFMAAGMLTVLVRRLA